MIRLLKKILLPGLVVLVIAGSWFVYDYNTFMATPLSVYDRGETTIVVPRGRAFGSISRELAERDIITRARYLDWTARLGGAATKIHAGEYRITAGMTPAEFIDMLVTGKVVQYSFTIIEGWNVRQLLDALRQSPHLEHTLPETDADKLFTLIGHNAGHAGIKHAEGWFFPDTYFFPRGETDTMVLQRAHNAMHDQLDAAWQQRGKNLPYETPYEALIMASIIEKETGKGEEREQIAGVFTRRLQKGMKLQTDPTVIYGIKGYDGNIRRRDLLTDTPYNTYTRKGLPPTPIAMPGRAAIDAALHPDNGNALYFVARGDGSHVFSATLEEHNEAVIKYQLNGKRKNFSSFNNK